MCLVARALRGARDRVSAWTRALGTSSSALADMRFR